MQTELAADPCVMEIFNALVKPSVVPVGYPMLDAVRGESSNFCYKQRTFTRGPMEKTFDQSPRTEFNTRILHAEG